MYRVQNWNDYNNFLINRGKINFWINEETAGNWQENAYAGFGRPKFFSDVAITIAIDSTGLKIYGEGEWKVKIHGKSKRRTWRKLHLGINLANQSIVSAKLTTANVHDAKVLDELLPQKINTVLADGIYDTFEVYENSLSSNGEPIIPPRSTASISSKKLLNHQVRNNVVKAVKRLGPKLWKELSGYHKRSLVETAMSRLKRFFGSGLKNRNFKHQEVESYLRCSLINHFTKLGMPISIKI